jgi:hypothetical protein
MPNQYTNGTMLPPPADVRFWPKVNKNGPIPAHAPHLGPCWIWTACRRSNGYGKFKFGDRVRSAHVVAYILTTGHEPPVETPWITHLCDGGDIGCVRPSHLQADTHEGNMLAMRARGRSATGDRNGSRTRPDRQVRGERQGGAKLTADQVREIRQHYAAGGVTHQTLASEYGVVRQTISDILTRKHWRHLGP